MSRFEVGDKVRVVNYGHPIWESKVHPDRVPMNGPIISETDLFIVRDMSPELIGQVGTISQCTITQGQPKYAIVGIKGKHAWYDEGQLENE